MTTPDIDINEITASVINAQLSVLRHSIIDRASNAFDLLQFTVETTIRNYVTRMFDNLSHCRSFFNRQESEYIYSFYVPASLRSRDRHLPDTSSSDLFSVSPRSIIQGSGGSGKTMLARHLIIDTLESTTKLPVLVELRTLNTHNTSLLEAIRESLKGSGLTLRPASLTRALNNGSLAIFFDGFDELHRGLRDEKIREIQDLAKMSNDLWITVTSRPDASLSDWKHFNVFDVCPLTIEHALDLVKKTPVDDSLKERFSKELEAALFEKHKSFLSNPLLLSIMLLTYYDSADIPNKLSHFYSQAFESLFQRHDAWKSGFRRQRQCNLDMCDFGRLFSALSLITYDAPKLEFTRSELLGFVKQASEITSLPVTADHVIDDSTQAVCLLVEDGLELSYSHRSFQEYFTARFIADCSPEVKSQLLRRVSQDVQQDAVVALLFEMQPEFVEVEFVIPALDALFKEIKLARGMSHALHWRYVKALYTSVEVDADSWRMYINEKNIFNGLHAFGIVGAMMRLYRGAWEAEAKNARREKDYKAGRQDIREWGEKNAGKPIDIQSASVAHPFVKYLFGSTVEMGGVTLSWLIKLRKSVGRRSENTRESLLDLLSTSER